MVRVVVTGSASALGRRVVALLSARDDVDEVVGLDLRSAPSTRPVDLLVGDLGPFVEGADAVIHLASAFGPAVTGVDIDAHHEFHVSRTISADVFVDQATGRIVLTIISDALDKRTCAVAQADDRDLDWLH